MDLKEYQRALMTVEVVEAFTQRTTRAPVRLPARISSRTVSREDLSSLWGVVFGANSDDGLFVSVTFPEGWQVSPTPHPMWCDLVAPDGSTRASIFYKNANHDHRAHMVLMPRYGVSMDVGDYRVNGSVNGLKIVDHLLKKTLVHVGTYAQLDYAQGDALETEATLWLDNQYPDHKNPLAYWNDK